MESYLSVLIVVVVGLFVLSRSLRVASEHERFAEIDVGRFTGFKGPGIVFKLSRGAQWLRVKVGDRGELLAPGVARFGGHELPVETTGMVEQQFPTLLPIEALEGAEVCQWFGFERR